MSCKKGLVVANSINVAALSLKTRLKYWRGKLAKPHKSISGRMKYSLRTSLADRGKSSVGVKTGRLPSLDSNA